MIELKTKCSICGKEEFSKNIIIEASNIIKKYNLKSEHYLSLLNLMSERCLDSSEHSFIFDETFLKQVEELATKYKNNIDEIDKLKTINVKLLKEEIELNEKLEELKNKIKSNKERIKNFDQFNINYEDEIKESTGYGNVEIWY